MSFSKRVSEFAKNDNIFSAMAIPGIDYYSYEILKKNHLHTPWALCDLYSSYNLRIDEYFCKHLVKLGISEYRAKIITIAIHEKVDHKRSVNLKKRQAWILPHKILVNYF